MTVRFVVTGGEYSIHTSGGCLMGVQAKRDHINDQMCGVD